MKSIYLIAVVVVLAAGVLFAAEDPINPVWVISLNRADIRPRTGFAGSPERNRSCGIQKWDDTHILLYALKADRHLIRRDQIQVAAEPLVFSVLLVDIATGKIDKSIMLPAEGTDSELAVTVGGIVKKDENRLTFYSRNFTQISIPFAYKPLHPPMPFFREGMMGDHQQIFLANDQKHFVLVDSNGGQSHFYVFDGQNFQLIRHGIASNVNWLSISMGDSGLMYTDPDFHRKVYWTTFDGITEEWRSDAISVHVPRWYMPVYIDENSFLNISPLLEVIDRKTATTIYKSRGNTGIALPGVVAGNKKFVAVLEITEKGGGVFDRNIHIIRKDILLIGLDKNHKTCRVPVDSLPKAQLVFSIVNNSIIVILNDGIVSAYSLNCIK